MAARGPYSPTAVSNIESQQEEFRTRMLALLAGNSSLKMEITNIPAASVDPSEN
ncbi:DUF6680 family protein [Herbaspirillum hiltneri]|uniref:DUF6680 family protein n=1 Tax=Herbaspirillum hiltneri TaxID=341045 RepID=UPI0038991931